jgi:hypothetical protein
LNVFPFMAFLALWTDTMLTVTKLRNLKPGDKLYKVNDRDGLYVAVTPAGSISFRYNYSINGRQETLTFGRHGVGGITLAEARERLGKAKRLIATGKSPANEKARDKARVKDAETCGAWVESGCGAIRWPTPLATCAARSSSAS